MSTKACVGTRMFITGIIHSSTKVDTTRMSITRRIDQQGYSLPVAQVAIKSKWKHLEGSTSQTLYRSKTARPRRVHTVRPCFKDGLEQAKEAAIEVGRGWGRGICYWLVRDEWTLWSDGNILYLDLGCVYTGIQVCKNSIKLHTLRFRHSAVCYSSIRDNNNLTITMMAETNDLSTVLWAVSFS